MLSAILPLVLFFAQAPASIPASVEDLLRQNRTAEAITQLSATLQREPRSGEESWALLARCYEGVGKPEEAYRALRAGLRAYPDSPRLSLSLGEVLFRVQPESSEAGMLLKRATDALPSDPEARHYYAQWAFLNDKENDCSVSEVAGLALPGLNAAAMLQMYTLLGMCEDKLDHPEKAEDAFRKALAINRRSPHYDPDAAIRYERFLSVAGKDTEARALVREIAAKSPSFGPIHLEMAKHFEESGKFIQGADEARLALAGQGNDNETIRSERSVLAKCLFALGRKKEAEEQRQLIDADSKGKAAK
jgi:tetratricopeptide (TPR) repeat protein